MWMTMEIDVSEIGKGFGRASGRDLTRAHETTKRLRDLDVYKVGRMQLVSVTEQAGFNSAS
jgi:hypothetical protein